MNRLQRWIYFIAWMCILVYNAFSKNSFESVLISCLGVMIAHYILEEKLV